jgi:hypothetical protein
MEGEPRLCQFARVLIVARSVDAENFKQMALETLADADLDSVTAPPDFGSCSCCTHACCRLNFGCSGSELKWEDLEAECAPETAKAVVWKRFRLLWR